MTRSSLAEIELDPETAERLERRAKRLGTTPEKEAARVLREWLATIEPSNEGSGTPAPKAPEEGANQAESGLTLVRKSGFLVFRGELKPDQIPDHRDIREERIDSFVRAALGQDRP